MPPKRGKGTGQGGKQEQDDRRRQHKYDELHRRFRSFEQRLPQGRYGEQKHSQEQDMPRGQQRFEEASKKPPSDTQKQDKPSQQKHEEALRSSPVFEQRSQKGLGELTRGEQQQGTPSGFVLETFPVEVDPVPHDSASELVATKQEESEFRSVHPEKLRNEFQHKSAVSRPFPLRLELGTLGRRIQLISNCFSFTIPSGCAYHYDVEIAGKRRNSLPTLGKKDKYYSLLSKKKNREIIVKMLETNQNFSGVYAAYDGQKNLYTRKPLNIQRWDTFSCEVIMPDENSGDPDDPRGSRQDVFKLRIKPVQKSCTVSNIINLDSFQDFYEKKITSVPQEAIMVLSTIFRQGLSLRFFDTERYIFYPTKPEDLYYLGGMKEIWFHYHQGLRLRQWSPMVNLDITPTTFYQKAPVLNYVADFLRLPVEDLSRKPYFTDAEIKQLNNELRNLRIEVNHLRSCRRKYRIIRVVRESANRLEFNLTENGIAVKNTLAAYFREQHKRELKYPNLPCLQVNPETKKVYLPIEVCEVLEGQRCKKKLDERQNADMIKFTASPPDKRLQKIKDLMRTADFNRDPHVREFGLEVSPEPLSLEGRVLDAPSIGYKDDAQIRPRNGSWNMQDTQFFLPADIESWVLISFSDSRFCSDDHLNEFAQILVRICQEVGISIMWPTLIRTMGNRGWNMEKIMKDMKNKYKADLVVVVVPSRNVTIYDDVKQAAETVVGLTTQCVKDDNVVKKCNTQLVKNLCLKINAKMGGVNNYLVPAEIPDVLREPVIIIGAAVSHTHLLYERGHSLSVCAGSLDGYPSRYAVACRIQKDIDIIVDLKGMIIELLKAFNRHTKGKTPSKIIFYRNGLGEGQFEKLRDCEVMRIREACRTLGEDYQPGITFIVVNKQKRSFFVPQNIEEGAGPMKNVPPGTVIDTTIVHPVNFDFLLCSHFSSQGTSRPRRYTVIEDDNDFTSNDLQKLTYFLCHTYVRCTKSISCPAPLAYAHLAAHRVRQRLVYAQETFTDRSDSSNDDDFHGIPRAVIDAVTICDELKSSMYFV